MLCCTLWMYCVLNTWAVFIIMVYDTYMVCYAIYFYKYFQDMLQRCINATCIKHLHCKHLLHYNSRHELWNWLKIWDPKGQGVPLGLSSFSDYCACCMSEGLVMQNDALFTYLLCACRVHTGTIHSTGVTVQEDMPGSKFWSLSYVSGLYNKVTWFLKLQIVQAFLDRDRHYRISVPNTFL